MSNVSTSFNSRLSKKQVSANLSALMELAVHLPVTYIDTGIIDNQFVQNYKSGAGADEDDFGKRFAFYAITHTVKKLNENKENFEEQIKILNNFGIATKGLAEHVFRRTNEVLNSRIKDSVTGLSNYNDLASAFVKDVRADNRYFEGRKDIIEACFKLTKPTLRRIK